MSISPVSSTLLSQTQPQSAPSSRISFPGMALQSQTTSPSSPSSLQSLLSLASPSSSTSKSTQSLLLSELGTLGAQLQAGNIAGAQQAYATFARNFSASGTPGVHPHGRAAHPHPVYTADSNSLNSPNASTGSLGTQLQTSA